MKATFLIVPVLLALLTIPASAAEKFPPSKVDFEGFVALSQEMVELRESRLVDFDTFQNMAAERGTLVLDVRSESAYKRKHIRGAVHLNFSDFTDEKLAKVIPSKGTRVLIYCNNNIEGDKKNFPTKRKPLALNIPTFVNLHGYGYENVYELKDLIPADHEAIVFEGTDVPAKVVTK